MNNITKSRKIFKENPYDIETVFESLSIASDNECEIIFMDMLINRLRADPSCDITNTSHMILQEICDKFK